MFLVALLVPLTVRAELAIPGTPLGVSQAAKPITLIVAGKDHKLFYEAYNPVQSADRLFRSLRSDTLLPVFRQFSRIGKVHAACRRHGGREM